MATPKAPKPFEVDKVKCRVVATRVNEAGKPEYRWRCYIHVGRDGKKNIWTGWGTPREVLDIVASLVKQGAVEAPPVPRGAPKTVTTIRDLMETWMAWEEHQPLKEHTIENYRRAASLLARNYGDIVLARVDTTFRETVAHELRRGGFGNATIGMACVVFGMAWGWGRDRGLTPNITLPKVKLSRKTKRDNESTYTSEDLWRIIDHFPVDSWMHMTARLYEATGCRPDELAHLDWSNVNLETCEIKVVVSKTGERWVPLPQSTVDFLLEQTPESKRKGRIVCGAAIATVRDGFRHHLKAACTELGISYCPPKQIRHATADRYYRSGADVATAAKVMGHSPVTAMKHYRRVTSDDRQRAVALAGLGERPEATGKVVQMKKAK